MQVTANVSDTPRTALEQAYLEAEYCLWLAGRELILRIGVYDEQAMSWLQKAGLSGQAAIITPHNPGSIQLYAADNGARLAAFRSQLKQDGLRWLPSVNRDPQGEWPAEPGALILDCPEQLAQDLCRQYGQNAHVRLAPERAPALIFV